MTRIPSHRAAACSGESSGSSWGCWDRSNRRGQDKSRNVRPVGWGQNSSDTNHLRHIAALARTLPIWSTPRIRCVFYTLRVQP